MILGRGSNLLLLLTLHWMVHNNIWNKWSTKWKLWKRMYFFFINVDSESYKYIKLMVSYTFNDLDIIQSNNNIDYFKVLVHLLGKITVIAEMSLIFLWKNEKKPVSFEVWSLGIRISWVFNHYIDWNNSIYIEKSTSFNVICVGKQRSGIPQTCFVLIRHDFDDVKKAYLKYFKTFTV